MDFFGIGAAVRGAAEIYFRSARRTGRTAAMLEALMSGDMVVCATSDEARYMNDLLRERNLSVDIVVVDPKKAYRVMDHRNANGRVLLSHDWVEQYYRHKIDTSIADIDEIQREASANGEPDLKSKLSKYEEYRWTR